MFLGNLFEGSARQVKVIYPGRFQPFHKGHAAVYGHLCQKYGKDNVYIVTSDKTDNAKSPFSFDEKKKMMILTGVSSDKVIMSTQPYRAMEIVSKLDPSSVLMFAISEKDMAEDPRFQFAPKKDGSPSYFQPFKDAKQCKPLSEHAYMITVPTFDFTVLGEPANSASQIRAQFGNADEETKKKIVADLFGKFDPVVYNIMNNKLLPVPAAVGESVVSEAGKKGMSAHAKEVARKRKEYDDANAAKREKEGETFHYGNAKVTIKPKAEQVNEISNDLSKNYMQGALHDTITGKKDRNPGISQAMNRISGTQYPLVPDTENPDPKIRSLAIAVEKMKDQLASLTGQPTTESTMKKVNELSSNTLGKYKKAASETLPKNMHQAGNRVQGVAKAKDKINDKEITAKAKAVGHPMVQENQINEISLKTKINAFAKRSQDDYASGENGGKTNSSDKVGANILRKHGQTAYDHANKAGNAAVMGRDDASGSSKSDTGDSLAKSGPDARIRKDGKINKQDTNALKTKIKSYGHGRIGSKANLPESDHGGVPWGPVAQKEYFENWHKWDQAVRYNGGTTEHAGDGTYRAVGIDDGGIGQWNEHTGEGWIDLTGESDLEESDPGYNKHSFIGRIRRGHEANNKGWGKLGDLLRSQDEAEARKELRKGNRYYNMTNPKKGSHTPGGFPKTSVPGLEPVEEGRFVKGPGGVPLDRQGNPRAVSFPSKQSSSSSSATRTTTDDSGVKVTYGKYHEPRKSEAPGFGSKHIGSGSGKGTTKGQVSGLGANTGKYVKPVVTADVNGDEASAVKEAGRFVKGPGGVPLDRRGDPIPPKPPKAPANKKLTLDDVWRKVEFVVGQIFPDGDPIDWVAPWLERHGIEDYKIGEIIDRAARKNGYKDMYAYYDELKAQHAEDNAYDSMNESGEDDRWKLYAKDDEKGYTLHHIPHSQSRPGEQRFKHSLNGKTVMSHSKHYPDEFAGQMNEWPEPEQFDMKQKQSQGQGQKKVEEGSAPWAANWKKAALASKKALQSPSGANHKRAAELHKHGASDPWGPYKDKHEEAFAKHTKAAKVYGEGVEKVDELSTDTMKRYMGAANKSRTDATTKFNQTGNIDPKTMDKMGNRAERTMKTANKVKAAEPMESKRSLKAIVKEMHAQAAQGNLRAVAECVRALVPFKQKESLKEGIMTNVNKALKVAKRNAG